MKKKILIALFGLILFVKAESQTEVGVSISFQDFYSDLSPYGVWIEHPAYGYVWAPNAGRYFKPYYSSGHWVYTEYGWTWVSDYSWGWAPFHYGRWVYDTWRGWLWIPGYEWGPGWVTWAYCGSNYGWAPLGPGVDISVNFGWRPPSTSWWVFVPMNRFGYSGWQSYAVNHNIAVQNRITIINNRYEGNYGGGRGAWSGGPKVEEVERYSRAKIQPLPINNANRPQTGAVGRSGVTMYRPSVKKGDFKPSRVESFDHFRSNSRAPSSDQGDVERGNRSPNPPPANRNNSNNKEPNFVNKENQRPHKESKRGQPSNGPTRQLANPPEKRNQPQSQPAKQPNRPQEQRREPAPQQRVKPQEQKQPEPQPQQGRKESNPNHPEKRKQ